MRSDFSVALREWACPKGHVFWHNAAVPSVKGDSTAAIQALLINGGVRCPCGELALDDYSVGEISGDQSCYQQTGTDLVTIPAEGLYFDANGKRLRAGAKVRLQTRDFSSLTERCKVGK